MFLSNTWVFTYIVKIISIDIQQRTYSTHIYLICIVYVHISWFYKYSYDILVDIQAPQIATSTKEKLSQCVAKVYDKKDMAEAVSDVVKQKAEKLKPFLVQVVEIWEDKLVHLVGEIEEYKKSMEVAEWEMRESMSAFMAAHGTTLEVLGEAGKIQYKQRFCTKVSTDVKCIFCTMQFPSVELCKKHMIDSHWAIFQHTVSICYTC